MSKLHDLKVRKFRSTELKVQSVDPMLMTDVESNQFSPVHEDAIAHIVALKQPAACCKEKLKKRQTA